MLSLTASSDATAATMEALIERKVQEALRARDEADASSTALPPPGESSPPFDMHQELFGDGGLFSIDLPEGIWSAALVMPLIAPPDIPTASLILFLMPAYVGLAFSVSAQCVCLYYLGGIVKDGGGACDAGGAPLLRIVCLCVLVACVTEGDLLETMRMRRWLRYVPRWDAATQQPIADRLRTSVVARRLTSRAQGGLHRGKPITVTALVTGFTDRYRVLANVGILLPKLAVGVTTLLLSAGYILYADSNEDLILNTVATLFILEVRRVVCLVFVRGSMRGMRGARPLFPAEMRDRRL